MDEAELDDVLDEWFIESLKTYKDLHVYHLEHPTQVLEWTSGKTVCVAGFSTSSKNEILELSLPLRLLAEQNKGLCAQRDFKVVHGGFSDAPVQFLKHIPGTRCAVSNDGRSASLQLWDLGAEDSDVIRRTGSIEARGGASVGGASIGGALGGGASVGGRRIAAPLTSSSEPKILHGTRTDDILLTDVTTGRDLYKLDCGSSESLSSLQFVSDGAFVAGSVKGSLLVADSRSSAAAQVQAAPGSSSEPGVWFTAASRCKVLRLSSSGETLVSDLRKMDVCVSQAQIQTNGRSLNATVSWAPALEQFIALSGLNGLVQIYDTSLWGAEPQVAQPQFEHRGHMVSSPQSDVITTSHVWHPERARTLLSAASDASVHVWDWIDQSERG